MQQIGLIGLAVMGENLALNIERNGFPIAVYNRSYAKTEALLSGRAKGKNVVGAKTPAELVAALARPRRIIVMVKAGDPVDAVIAELRPLLESGDILVDGGNSHFSDTDRRAAALDPTGIEFFGMGVSGGEEGALWGPSLMPGGDEATYRHLEPILTKIAAKADSGPCVTYVGRKSAGHFVKMVHNGIEYGDMQLIAESYDLMRHGLGLGAPEIARIFAEWNAGELQSFLIEITAKIVNFKDDRGGRRPLIDAIVDAAGQKGTGKWTTQAALDLGIAIPTITAAVDARIMSSQRATRLAAAKVYPPAPKPLARGKKAAIADIRAALYAAKICSYAQGFALLAAASKEFDYGVKLGEMARIWKGGCIIRAAFLDRIRQACERDPHLANLLLDRDFAKAVKARVESWRRTVHLGVKLGIALPAMAASLAYFDGFRRARTPANLIQGQRDFFGAHTYARLDRDGIFHTDWSSDHDDTRSRG
ncbi:MAG: phosphogluconate dehydrogenase (NADP(+)-dependent, decarboxylating) [Polyangiaceae bacterium UTPRO1]|jgi:6-phosphogluconate dehydrogenase|nr:NADP-dependent phosphogluconate dehydrogenase [Myxococcales bacterium]OQY65629.1 MAG: phosphogluconate dehydrogenase (NADP(+)-dependent, decarboxylating) [Polyangiaceae bacterium UTPRO1]